MEVNADLFHRKVKAFEQADANRRATQVTTEESDPVAAAENLQVSEQLGVSPQAVTVNPDLYHRMLQQRQTETALQDAPKLNNWLDDPANRALAKPELDTLAAWEKLDPLGMLFDFTGASGRASAVGLHSGAVGLQRMGASLGALPNQGQMQANLNILNAFEQIGDSQGPIDLEGLGLGGNQMSVEASFVTAFLQATPEERDAMTAAFVARISEQEGVNEWFIEAMKAYSQQIQEFNGDTTTGWQDIDWTSPDVIQDFSEFVGYSIGQAAPYMLVSGIAGALGGAPGLLTSSGLIAAGDITSDAVEEMDPSQPLDTTQIALGTIPYAAAEYLGPVAARVRGIFGRGAGTVVDSFFQNWVRNVPLDALEEYTNEFTQEMVKDIFQARALGQEPDFSMQALMRWHGAGMAGASVGTFLGTGATVVSTARQGGGPTLPTRTRISPKTRAMMADMGKALTAGRTAMTLERVDQMVAATQMKELAPAKFEEYLVSLGLDDQQIFVPAEGVRVLFQEQGIPITEETLAEWGIDGGQLEAAMLTGGNVSISMSTYASKIAGTNQAEWVHENGTLDANEMSLNEARLFADARAQDLVDEQAATEAERQVAAERAERGMQVYDGIYRQSLEAGASEAVADTRARVTTAMRTGLMDAFGEDAWMAGNYDQLFDIEIRTPDVPPMPQERTLTQPGAPATIETLPEGWQDADIEVELEDGEVAVAKAGEVLEYQNQRIKDIMAVLRCIDG